MLVRAHSNLVGAQPLPEKARNSHSLWLERSRSARDIERQLHENGTRIVKFYLHLSIKQQCRRFLARLKEPDTN